MRRLLVLFIIILFFNVSSIPSEGTIIEKESLKLMSDGNILFVGGSGLDNYTMIQDAIDNASDGDTVFVYGDSSPYNENIVINKSTILLVRIDIQLILMEV